MDGSLCSWKHLQKRTPRLSEQWFLLIVRASALDGISRRTRPRCTVQEGSHPGSRFSYPYDHIDDSEVPLWIDKVCLESTSVSGQYRVWAQAIEFSKSNRQKQSWICMVMKLKTRSIVEVKKMRIIVPNDGFWTIKILCDFFCFTSGDFLDGTSMRERSWKSFKIDSTKRRAKNAT